MKELKAFKKYVGANFLEGKPISEILRDSQLFIESMRKNPGCVPEAMKVARVLMGSPVGSLRAAAQNILFEAVLVDVNVVTRSFQRSVFIYAHDKYDHVREGAHKVFGAMISVNGAHKDRKVVNFVAEKAVNDPSPRVRIAAECNLAMIAERNKEVARNALVKAGRKVRGRRNVETQIQRLLAEIDPPDFSKPDAPQSPSRVKYRPAATP